VYSAQFRTLGFRMSGIKKMAPGCECSVTPVFGVNNRVSNLQCSTLESYVRELH
jgi:hypothetical protein